MIAELIILSAFLVFLFVLLLLQFVPKTHRCTKCGDVMEVAFVDLGCPVYRCGKCGKYKI